MHEIWLNEKPRLAAAGAAYHQHVFVPRRLGVFGTVGHHEPLGLGENDVVLKLRIDVRGDILGPAPTGRAVFQIFAEFLGVLALDVHDKPNEQSGCNAHAQVDGVEAGQRRLERGGKALHEVQRLSREIHTGGKPPRLPQLGGKEGDKDIRDIGQQELLDIQRFLHIVMPLFWFRDLPGVMA